MVLNETTNMTLFYLASRAARTPADIFNWTYFWKFRGELPGCSPPNCGIS